MAQKKINKLVLLVDSRGIVAYKHELILALNALKVTKK